MGQVGSLPYAMSDVFFGHWRNNAAFGNDSSDQLGGCYIEGRIVNIDVVGCRWSSEPVGDFFRFALLDRNVIAAHDG